MANIVKKSGKELDLTEEAARKISVRSKKKKFKAEKGENAHYLEHSMELAYLPKIDTHNAEEVKQRTIDYFLICQKADMKPSVAGYALALGVTRNTLGGYLSGRIRNTPDVIDAMTTAYAILNHLMETWMQDGKIYPVAGIFLAKNSFGYKDVSETIVKSDNDDVSAEDLIKGAELLPD